MVAVSLKKKKEKKKEKKEKKKKQTTKDYAPGASGEDVISNNESKDREKQHENDTVSTVFRKSRDRL